MYPLINFKVCDNSPECDAVANCPTGAITWDEKNETLLVTPEKCIGCQKCVLSCPVRAIKLVSTPEEEEAVRKEFEEDAVRVGELFVNRYGAMPIGPSAGIKESEVNLDDISDSNLSVIELDDPENLTCMRASIPIKRLFDSSVHYLKVFSNRQGKISKQFKLTSLPALIFFKEGKFIGKIEGGYDIDNEAELQSAIKKIISV